MLGLEEGDVGRHVYCHFEWLSRGRSAVELSRVDWSAVDERRPRNEIFSSADGV